MEVYSMNNGTLRQNGVHLQEHEYSTVKFLLNKGFDIELIPPSQTKGQKTADIIMNGKTWEMKSPVGSGKNTLRHIIQNAGHQSRNVIVDLRRCKLSRDTSLKELAYYFKLSKRIRRLIIIIVDDEEIIDYQK